MQSNSEVKGEKMKVMDFLAESAITIDLAGTNKKTTLQELVELLKNSGKIKNTESVLGNLLEREKLGSTGIGQGVAIPHAKSDEVTDVVAAFGISRKGIAFDALDGEPVRLVFLLVAPQDASGQHVKALARVSRLLKDKFLRQALMDSKTVSDVVRVIHDEDQF